MSECLRWMRSFYFVRSLSWLRGGQEPPGIIGKLLVQNAEEVLGATGYGPSEYDDMYMIYNLYLFVLVQNQLEEADDMYIYLYLYLFQNQFAEATWVPWPSLHFAWPKTPENGGERRQGNIPATLNILNHAVLLLFAYRDSQ